MRNMLKLIPVAVLLALTLSGCSHRNATSAEGGIALGDSFRQTALLTGASRLTTEMYVDAVTMSAEATQQTSELRVREDSLQWRINTVTRLDDIKQITDPRSRFAALWTYITQLRYLFTEGPQKTRFGDVQAIYVHAIRSLEARALAVAYEALPNADVERLRPEIEQLARGEGIRAFAASVPAVAQQSALGHLISMPLAPISGLQGVSDTPNAINRFTDTAGGIGTIVENLPERARWQVELLLLESQHSGAVADALTQAKTANQQFAQFNATVKQLPDRAEQILQNAERMQPQLGENLTKVENSMKLAVDVTQGVNTATASIQAALGDVDKSAAAVELAAREIRLLAADLKPASRPITEPRSGGDIDVKQVGEMAVQMRSAAAEIRSLLTELKETKDVPAVSQVTLRVHNQISDLIWQATWSVAGLIALLVLLASAYAMTARRRNEPVPYARFWRAP